MKPLVLSVLCFLSVSAPLRLPAMDRFAALSMIESGDNDHAVGPAGEISRYQIRADVWHQYTTAPWSYPSSFPHSATNAAFSLRVAFAIMACRDGHFLVRHGFSPDNVQWYLLWNCPADVEHPSKREFARAQRFANLCSKP